MRLGGDEWLLEPSKFSQQLKSWLEVCQEMLVEGGNQLNIWYPIARGVRMGLKKAIANRSKK